MYSIVDRKQHIYIQRYGKVLGMFLLEKVAQYEGDFMEKDYFILRFNLFERGISDEEDRIESFREKHREDNVFHTYITHNALNRSFHLLMSY